MSSISVSGMPKRMFYFLFCVAVMAAWSQPGFAVRQNVAGAVPTPLDANGVTDGVDMTAQGGGGTLLIGTQDVFTLNSGPLAIIPQAISTDVASMSDITFSGISTVYGEIGTAVLIFNYIQLTAGASTINFLGTVFTTTMDVATGTVNFNSETGTNVGAVNFTGDGTVTLAPNTTFTGALTTATAQTGTLNLANASQWTGALGGATGLRAIGVVGNGASAGITGAVDVYSFNLGNNTLNVNGSITLRNPGPNSINTTLTSDTVYGRIVASGGATTLPATLGVNVTVPATTVLTPGTTFNIIDSTSGPGTSVVAVTIQNPTNPLYTFSAVPPSTINGDVNILLTGVPLTAVPLPVVPVILGLPLTPGVTSVVAAINALNTTDVVASAVEQLIPSTPTLAAPQVTFQRTRQFQNLWLSRLDICRGDKRFDNRNPDACRNNDPKSGWWAQGFGKAGEQDARQDTLGYDSMIAGGMVAYDVPLGPDTRAGLGVGFARSEIDGNKHDTEVEIDTFQATAYIGHERGPWFVRGSATFGWNEYSAQRHIVFPGVNLTTDADYNGQDYTVFAKAGYHIFTPDFTITPLASIQYSHVKLDGYTETGAVDLNLDLESQDYDFAESGLGVKIERDYSYADKKLVPEIHFNWFHMLSNPTPDLNAKYDSGTMFYTTRGHDMDEDTFNVGAGLTLISCGVCDATTWLLEAVYDHEWRDDGYSAHQGMLRFSMRF